MVAIPVGSTLLSEAILVAIIALVLFIIFTIGKGILKVIFGIIANSILGLVAIFVLNYFFNLAIPIQQLYILIPTALFGLPAVGTIVIFKFFGVLAVIV